jgi:hypothetical protein
MREKGGGQTGLDEQVMKRKGRSLSLVRPKLDAHTDTTAHIKDWNVARYLCYWTPRHGRQESPFNVEMCLLPHLWVPITRFPLP